MLNFELALWHEINRDKETICWSALTALRLFVMHKATIIESCVKISSLCNQVHLELHMHLQQGNT